MIAYLGLQRIFSLESELKTDVLLTVLEMTSGPSFTSTWLREFSTVGMEDLLREQLVGIEKLMDKYDEKNKSAVEAQAKVLDLELENVVVVERMSLLEEPLKMEERMICSDVWAETLKKTLLL